MAKLHHPHAGLLLVRDEKQLMIALSKDLTSIGRKQADILLDDPKASSRHAEIRRDGTRYILVDLKSTNGTFLNKHLMTDPTPLNDQDVIEIGFTTLCFFEDARQFHGAVETTWTGVPLPQPTQDHEASQKTKTTLTTTEKLFIPQIELKVVQGPDQGKIFTFRKSHVTLGRSDTDVQLVDLDISRSHALVEVLSNQTVFIKDLDSTNGTHINGKKVAAGKLTNGDLITMGATQIRIHVLNEPLTPHEVSL